MLVSRAGLEAERHVENTQVPDSTNRSVAVAERIGAAVRRWVGRQTKGKELRKILRCWRLDVQWVRPRMTRWGFLAQSNGGLGHEQWICLAAHIAGRGRDLLRDGRHSSRGRDTTCVGKHIPSGSTRVSCWYHRHRDSPCAPWCHPACRYSKGEQGAVWDRRGVGVGVVPSLFGWCGSLLRRAPPCSGGRCWAVCMRRR